MRFEIQKSTKRGIEYFERLGALYHEKGTTNKTLTPACTDKRPCSSSPAASPTSSSFPYPPHGPSPTTLYDPQTQSARPPCPCSAAPCPA